jgi:hypothetical protein
MSGDRILDRIAREAGLPRLAEVLAGELPAADLQSLLLHVLAQRARQRRPADLLAQAERQAAVQPSSADARLLREVDAAAFASAPGFEALELAPACPLGTTAVLGGIHPNNVLATVRGSEAMADPTAALAVEAARRRHGAAGTVRLCASERALRLQPTDIPGFTPHFRILGLVTAGRAEAEDRFETDALTEHLQVHLGLLQRLGGQGFRSAPVTVSIGDTEATSALLQAHGVDEAAVRARVRAHDPGSPAAALASHGLALPSGVEDPVPALRAALGGAPPPQGAAARLARVRERVVPALARSHPGVAVRFDLGRLHGLGYYSGLCLHVVATDREGIAMPVADGGSLDWTRRLLSNGKERLFTSGLGLELLVKRFR